MKRTLSLILITFSLLVFSCKKDDSIKPDSSNKTSNSNNNPDNNQQTNNDGGLNSVSDNSSLNTDLDDILAGEGIDLYLQGKSNNNIKTINK